MSENNFIRGQLDQAVKEHYVYDGSNRLIEHYTALASARNGDFAIKTTYSYVLATDKLENSKESRSTWNSAWDI